MAGPRMGTRGIAAPRTSAVHGYAPRGVTPQHGYGYHPQYGGAGFGYGHNGFYGHGFEHHHHRGFYPYYGYYPAYGYAYYPSWGWDYGDSSMSSYDYQQQQQADYNQQLATQGEVQYLQQQVRDLQQQQQEAQEQAGSDAPGQQPVPAATKPEDLGPPTTIIFRDGKKMETQNYAIVGSNLWLLAENGHMRKYPLSELDREATLKSNEDRGVEFKVPQ